MSRIDKQKEFTFDDIMLLPKYSKIASRKDVEVGTTLCRGPNGDIILKIPIIASNMDSVCETRMAAAMSLLGGCGFLHRYTSIENQSSMVKQLQKLDVFPICAAVGIKDAEIRTKELVKSGVHVIVIDVAHGDTKAVVDTTTLLHTIFGTDISIIVGNVVTAEAALRLEMAGADAIRVGIGGGSICSTRLVTGHGRPQLSSLLETSESVSIPIISDGGIRRSGDIVKALACGADSVMLGSLLAGTDESPGEIFSSNGNKCKMYRGMASFDAQHEYFGNDPEAPEGITTVVEYSGSVEKVIKNLVAGIRAGLSYSGAQTIKELQQIREMVFVTGASVTESLTVRPYSKVI